MNNGYLPSMYTIILCLNLIWFGDIDRKSPNGNQNANDHSENTQIHLLVYASINMKLAYQSVNGFYHMLLDQTVFGRRKNVRRRMQDIARTIAISTSCIIYIRGLQNNTIQYKILIRLFKLMFTNFVYHVHTPVICMYLITNSNENWGYIRGGKTIAYFILTYRYFGQIHQGFPNEWTRFWNIPNTVLGALGTPEFYKMENNTMNREKKLINYWYFDYSTMMLRNNQAVRIVWIIYL